MKQIPSAGEIEKPSDVDSANITRILFIDKNASFVDLCTQFLLSDEQINHQVTSVSSVQEAKLVCAASEVDCVVMDYRLQGEENGKAIQQLRNHLGNAMPPTIVQTIDEGEATVIEAIRSGASDVLVRRDVTRESLCRAVSNAVEKGMLKKSLTGRVKELELANSLLRKRNAEIQRFYHTVSHEVKTPLTAIQEFVSIVHDGLAGELKEEQRTILNYALESCDQITSQFNDLLELSRFETGKMAVELSPQSIYNVFDHCIVSATPKAIARKITIAIEGPADLPKVMMEANRIIQVLSNLLSNAIKFTSVGGKVVVRCEASSDGSALQMSVSDTGCGIHAGDIKHIFERLYQVTPASDREDETGMGLGLSIASEIVRLHGSRIEVISEVGVGSVFSFELQALEQVEMRQAA